MRQPVLDLRSATPELWAAFGAIGRQVAELGLDPRLRDLLLLRASQLNECDYCVALHTRTMRSNGEREERITALPRWRESPLFDLRDRAALALVEALTLLEGRVEEAFAAAREVLHETELAAVLWTAATIGGWNRLAIATGMDPRRAAAPQPRHGRAAA
jgi:AhpD family alkylhydroperoxidase